MTNTINVVTGIDNSITEKINNHTSKEKIEDIFYEQARKIGRAHV